MQPHMLTMGTGGTQHVKDVFKVFVEQGGDVSAGARVKNVFYPLNNTQTTISFTVFKTAVLPPPRYTTAAGMVSCETVSLPIPPGAGGQPVACEFEFGDTEITVCASGQGVVNRCVLAFNE